MGVGAFDKGLRQISSIFIYRVLGLVRAPFFFQMIILAIYVHYVKLDFIYKGSVDLPEAYGKQKTTTFRFVGIY